MDNNKTTKSTTKSTKTMENTIANVKVNNVENQVKLRPIIIQKANTINLIYNCMKLKDFQYILNMNTNNLLKDVPIEDISQKHIEFIGIFAIIDTGYMYQIWDCVTSNGFISGNKVLSDVIENRIINGYKCNHVPVYTNDYVA